MPAAPRRETIYCVMYRQVYWTRLRPAGRRRCESIQWEDGDGNQDLQLYKRPALKGLRELLSNERLAGYQHFGFKLYNNSQDSDSSVLACDANGSVTFHFNQISVGPDTGPISIVLYVNVTFIKRDIPIRPVYRKLYNMLYSRLHHLLN